ncbi:hypothetical protein Pmar_PMAR021960 [Perkinsus marinus ATCC 50983]|uniref:Uncharacterized protein n=1 Tax=Perkinsus marinus (strain ATCC 50983 / TXsc) TaxID=423536 RepID=C5LRN0_PERM5|nr:hypothetical protein Pmar_PMAR021960 [Perkinsus marinus ATCC 50983]EER00589.1 hypothetical protein Pmar_PMAR021960 [Perkinsus marinus ATCC 50983]|eukprot:XP_002767871.1 hypothetical protein Pmar_PMAR021960 [Perkinsus marinus ATCC 50983]
MAEKAEVEKKAVDSEQALLRLKAEKAEVEKKAVDAEQALLRLKAEKGEVERRAEESEQALERLQAEKIQAVKDVETKLLEANVQHADSLIALQRRYEEQTRDAWTLAMIISCNYFLDLQKTQRADMATLADLS